MADQIPEDVKVYFLFIPDFWEQRGWGYAVSIIKKNLPGKPRDIGWDGGYGTCAYWDPKAGVVVIMLPQRPVKGPAYSETF